MLCKYSYQLKYRGQKEFGEYLCDVEDFKKWFRKAKNGIRCLIVWLENGEVWLWQPKSISKYSGWQKALSSHDDRLKKVAMAEEEESVRLEELNYIEY